MIDITAIEESHVNETEGYHLCDPVFSRIADTIFADYEQSELRGEIFRYAQREFGRCTGKVYVDRPNAPATPIGWVFEKIDHYTDTGEPFKHTTWVTLLHKHETVTTIEYAELEGRVC